MAASSPPPLNTEALGSKFVTLYVGPKRKEFALHRKLLCDKSNFFSKAFSITSNFKESSEGIMYLPEDDPNAFEAVVNWIYRDQVPQISKILSPETKLQEKKIRDLLQSLAILAEKYCMNLLQNRVVDTLQDSFSKSHRLMGDFWIRKVYKQTPQASKIRKFCVAQILMILLNESYKEIHSHEYAKTWGLLEDIPDLAVDVARFQIEFHSRLATKPKVDSRLRSEMGYGRCFFHKHSEGEKCHLDVV